MNTQSRATKKLISTLRDSILGTIISLIITWILSFFADAILLHQLKIFLGSILIISSSIYIVFFKAKILNTIWLKIIFLFLFMILESTILTVIPSKEVTLNTNASIFLENKKIQQNSQYDLISTPYNKIKANYISLGELRDTELHILLTGEWTKTEANKFINLKRNYQGKMYFITNYDCNKIELVSNLKLVNYSFKPGSRVLSHIIGFFDAAYINSVHQIESKEKVKNLILNSKFKENVKNRFCS